MPLVTQRDTKILSHIIMHSSWLHLRMGQELSHKSVFPSRPPHSLYLGHFPENSFVSPQNEGERPLHPPVPTAEPLPAPTSDFILGEFWKYGNGGGTSKQTPRFSTPPMLEGHWVHCPSWSHLQTPWPPHQWHQIPRGRTRERRGKKIPEKEEEPYQNTQFQPFLKSQPWSGLTAKQHLLAPPLSCHLLASKGSHQHAQVYVQSNKNLENQTTTNYG